MRTNKSDKKEELTAKSRFVVPGHNDQDLGQFRSDSPTAPQLALYFLMVISAACSWDLMSFDVETAFLSGVALARELYCWPPNDVKAMKAAKTLEIEERRVRTYRGATAMVVAHSRRLA